MKTIVQRLEKAARRAIALDATAGGLELDAAAEIRLLETRLASQGEVVDRLLKWFVNSGSSIASLWTRVPLEERVSIIRGLIATRETGK